MDVPELIKKVGLRKGLSPRTIKTYINCTSSFLKYLQKDVNEVKKSDILSYIDKLISKGAAGNTLNVNISAIKFFFEEVLGKRISVKISYSKVPKTLPTVLTRDEIIRLINATQNKKHSLMVKMMYSAGLRVSELLNLKVRDIEFDKRYGWVRSGKGNKDRLFILADSIIKQLQEHISKENKSYESYIFTGRNNQRMHQMSMHKIIKKAAKKAGIKKNVHCHTLRHSFGTHLIEDGYDIGTVQSLLGHSNPQTTMVYIHTSLPKGINVRSPLDGLEQKKSSSENTKD